MARYVLPVAGAVIGAYFGGPAGASLGWTIGAAIGGIVDPIEGPTVEGPRLNDLDVQSSAYGSPIPIGWGTTRQSGQVIWALPIEEVRKEEEVGGKGGGGSTQVTYEYFATFAVSLGKGPISDVIRMWADTKLVYSIYNENNRFNQSTLGSPPTDPNDITAGINYALAQKGASGLFTIYKGTTTQLPDPHIQADRGVSITPAFRGLAYIVFYRMPLKDFGNRIPNMSFEVAWTGTQTNVTAQPFAQDNTLSSDSDVAMDWLTGYGYCFNGSKITKWFCYDPSATELPFADEDDYISGGVGSPSSKTGNVDISRINNHIWCGDGDNFYRINSSTLKVDRFYTPDSGVGIYGPAASPVIAEIVTDYGVLEYIVYSHILATVPPRPFNIAMVIGGPGDTYTVGYEDYDEDGYILERFEALDSGALTDVFGLSRWVAHDGQRDLAHLYAISYAYCGYNYHYGDNTTEWFIYRMVISALGPSVETFYKLTLAELQAEFPSLSWPTDPAVHRIGTIYFDKMDNSLVIQIGVIDESSVSLLDLVTMQFKFDIASKTWSWGVEWPHGMNVSNANSATSEVYGTYIAASSSNVYVYDLRDGSTINTFAVASSDGFGEVFNSRLESVITMDNSSAANNSHYINLRYKDGTNVNVQTIIDDISERVGTDPNLFTIEASTTINGYVIARQVTGRSALQPLMTAKQFYIVESDFGLKVIENTDTTNGTVVAEDDLVDKGSSYVTENRISEDQIPSSISVVFSDKDSDYQSMTYQAKRSTNVSPTVQIAQEVVIELPMVLDRLDGKQLAEILLYSGWAERTTYSYSLPPKYLYLDVADVIQASFGGITTEQRIASASIGVNLNVEIDGTALATGQFSSTAETGYNLGFRPGSLLGTERTKYFLLDTPLLRDLDDVLRQADMTYHAGSGYGGSAWRGADLQKSSDGGSTYSSIDSLVSPVTWGFTTSALPDTDYPFTPDTETILTVTLTVGSLESISDSELLNDSKNAAAIINADGDIEIIQFRDVNALGNGKYELSYILRGRRGTDYLVSTHVAGDAFVLLALSSISKIPVTLSEIAVSRLYRAPSYGIAPDESVPIEFICEGNSLKPYAPVGITATLSGSDIDLAWVRRTRVNGGINDSSGTVPLNEDSEEYELEIWNAAGDTLLRTIVGLTSPAYTYTAANIATDFGTTPTSLNVIVYQISAQAGRGFGIMRNLEVE